MISISTQTLTLIGAIIAFGGTIFSIFFYFQKPQIAVEKRVQTLEEKNDDLQKQLNALKDAHEQTTEQMLKEVKDLTAAINGLNITVAKLETRIDERIPKGLPSLTPPGI